MSKYQVIKSVLCKVYVLMQTRYTTAMHVPNHLGLILDGNRRWAKARGLPTLEGHRQGAETFKTVALAAFDRGIECVSAYTFSSENWQRTEEEVGYLMKLLIKAVEKHLSTFDEAGIRVVVLGRRDGLDTAVLRAIEKTESKTTGNKQGTLALCFNYGGQDEIVDAVKQIMTAGTKPGDITKETLAEAMYHPEVPGVDLMIRTSGEQRTSGYMLYRSDYAELYFTDIFWPDFNENELDKALQEYSQRKRRFGK
jgi:undecaprenyl diphosphate synthase